MSQIEKPLVVVADDDPDMLNILEFHLTEWGYEARCAQNREQLFQHLSVAAADLVLLDLNFGEHSGIEVLSLLNREGCAPPVVILTAYGSIPTAIEATKLGAYDYLNKPPDPQHLQALVARIVERRRVQRRARGFNTSDSAPPESPPMLGDSLAMARVRTMIDEVAATDAKVLILGESGTGKELVARAIHAQSRRARGLFVPVNMAALPPSLAESVLFGHEKGSFTGADVRQKGWCEMADGGTLLLDEIGEMDLALQAKLLRFLQDHTFQRVGSSTVRTVDVRVLAATNRDPQELVREGRLREDLYYRLNVLPITLPPLRARRGDIRLLATCFLQRAAEKNQKRVTGFTEAALEALERYDWPGNVRQLENLVQRMVILSHGEEIPLESLPREFFEDRDAAGEAGLEDRWTRTEAGDEDLRRIDRIEKQAILDALEKSEGSVATAARRLGIGQATVYRKLKRYGIEIKRSRRVATGGEPSDA
jgi:DNA-binding NtrC family response regulator